MEIEVPSSESFGQITFDSENINGNSSVMSDNTLIDDTASTISITSISSPSLLTDQNISESSNQILSSTLRKRKSWKNCSNYRQLLQRSQSLNFRYVITMKNLFHRMQKEYFLIKKQANKLKKMVKKSKIKTQPTLSIPRLTLDQISAICHDEEHAVSQENLSDGKSDSIKSTETTTQAVPDQIKKKQVNIEQVYQKKDNQRVKKSTKTLWINNRQKPIDTRKYCFECMQEFSTRSTYLIHVRKLHDVKNHGKLGIDDLSSEMEESNDTVPVLSIDASRWLQKFPKSNYRKNGYENGKKQCDICKKTFRANYLRKHKERFHKNENIENESAEIHKSTSPSRSDISDGSSNSSNTGEANIQTLSVDRIGQPVTNEVGPIRKKIVFAVTCLALYQMDIIDEFISRFSLEVEKTAAIGIKTTHLIINDENHRLRSPLSLKLIEAIANHCYCVSFRWIVDCLARDRLVSEESFEIEGDNTEFKSHHGPRRSRLAEKKNSLFRNICFMNKCIESAESRISNERLEELIITCGGQLITCVTQRLLEKYQIIVLCDKTYVTERFNNYQQCKAMGIRFLSQDWVLESVLEYNLKSYALFEESPF